MLSPAGDDANPGTFDRPRRTLPKTPISGTTFLFRGGTYTDITADWSNASGITLSSYSGESPVLDGQYRYGSFLVLRDGIRSLTVSGLTITHYADSYGNGAIDSYGDVAGVRVIGNTFSANGLDASRDHHIYFGPASSQGRIRDWTIQGNRFLNPAASSIHAFGTTGAVNITITNNQFVGGQWGIIISEEGERDWTIANNTFTGITFEAVTLGTFATGPTSPVANIRLTRNLFSSAPGSYALRVDRSFVAARSLVEDNNLFWAGGAAPIMWSYPGPGHVLHVAEYRTASGMGVGSVEIDPNLTSAGRPANAGAAAFGA